MGNISKKLLTLLAALALATGIGAGAAWGDDFVAFNVNAQDDSALTEPIDITSIELSYTSCYYDGTMKSPTVTVRAGADVVTDPSDYELVTPAGRTAAGIYTYTVRGVGDYTGTATATLTINKTALSQCTFGKVPAQTYTGKALKPGISITFQGTTLKPGVDYSLSYSNNKKHGQAKVKVTGTGSCTETKTLKFTIKPASVAKAKITKVKSKTYNGSKQTQKPVVKVDGNKLKRGRDYTLSYKRNVNAGKATMIVKGKGNYKSKATKTFRIKCAPISKAQIDGISQYTETGGAIKPSPDVHMFGRTLVKGRDYKLSYSDNYYAGTARVKFTGKGNYRGTTTRSFSIVEPVLQTVYITRTGDCYHRDWCSSLRRSKIAISRSDAIARGYRACRNCRP